MLPHLLARGAGGDGGRVSGEVTSGAPERAPRTGAGLSGRTAAPVAPYRAMYLDEVRRSVDALLRQLPAGARVWFEDSDQRQHTIALFVLDAGATLALLYIDDREKDRKELTTRAARLDVLMEMQTRGYVPAIPGGITLAELIEQIKAEAEPATPTGHPAR